MHDHWRHSGPPVYMAVAAYLDGGKGKLVKKRRGSARPKRVSDERSARAFIRDFLGAGGKLN